MGHSGEEVPHLAEACCCFDEEANRVGVEDPYPQGNGAAADEWGNPDCCWAGGASLCQTVACPSSG